MTVIVTPPPVVIVASTLRPVVIVPPPLVLVQSTPPTVLIPPPTQRVLLHAAGGTVALPLTTKGDLLGYDDAAATPARFPVGSDGWILIADGGEDFGFKWIASPVAPAVRSAQVGTVIDHSGDEIKFETLAGPKTYTLSNPVLGRVVVLELGGVFAVTLPATVFVVNGDYIPNSGTNQLWLFCVDAVTPKYLASWTAPV